MSGDKVVVPPALLSNWGGPKVDDSSGDANQHTGRESFDVTKIAAQAATHVHLEDREPSSAVGNEAPRWRRRGNTFDGVPVSSTMSVPSRSRTISLGGIERPEVTGTRTLTYPPLQPRIAGLSSIAEASRPSSKHASSEAPRTKQPRPQSQAVGTLEGADLENTYVLQSLHNFGFPRENGTEKSAPVFFAEGSALEDGQPAMQSQPPIVRNSSDHRRFSFQASARRASVLVDRTVDGVQNAVAAVLNTGRKSSLVEMYEKAKVRQTKIKRSPVAQYAFEYSFYLLIIAVVYFVLVGMPLWSGVVWYIYIVFMRYLVVPAGTAVFLGIGFL